MPPTDGLSRALPDQLLLWVRRLETLLLALLLSGMVLLGSAQILMRNLFDSGWLWADPLLRIAVLWLGLLGALAATRTNHHIKIDILTRVFSPSLQRKINLINLVFSMVVCILLAWHGGRFVWQEYQAGIQGFAQLPAWWFESIIPIGFGLMAVRFLLLTMFGEPGASPERSDKP